MKILPNTTNGRCIPYIYQALMLFLFFLTATATQAQFTEDFEGPASAYTASQQCNNTRDRYFTSTDGTDIDGIYNNADGSFFAAQNLEKQPCSGSPSFLTFDDIDISTLSSIVFCVDIAEDDDDTDPTKQDWDFDDFLHFDYDIDNSGSFTPMLWVEADESTLSSGATENGLPRIDTDFDGDGDGAEITADFTQHCVSIAVTGTTMDIQVEFAFDNIEEDVAIDNFSLCTGSVTFMNSDPTSTVNVFSVDGTGHQTWIGVEIAPGQSWDGSAAEGETFNFRDVTTSAFVDDYTFGPLSCSVDDYSIQPYTDDLICDAGQGGFQAYASSTGANAKDFKRNTMYNGPYNNELFEDHIGEMVGITGNTVFLLDPVSGQFSSYILTTGKYIKTFAPTAFTGGDAAGSIASATIIGISGIRINVLGTDGSIDTYSLNSGNLLTDHTVIAFIDGPLTGMNLADVNIIGSRSINFITVLEADGTLIEYSIHRGKLYGDYPATSLSGGVTGGSTFAAEAASIVGVNSVGDVLLVSECIGTVVAAPLDHDQQPISRGSMGGSGEVSFYAYPNPMLDDYVLTVEVEHLNAPVKSKITVMDAVGKIFKIQNMDALENGTFNIDMDMPQGVYFIRIQSRGFETKILKVTLVR